MKLIFIRHAEPDYSIDSLTEKGWREAKLLAERTKKWSVTEFFCSPLGRAKDTALFTLKEFGKEATIYPWLKEFYYRVKDPYTGQDRVGWDFMPGYFTKEELLYDRDKWTESAIYKHSETPERIVEVRNGIDEVLREHGYRREGRLYIAERPNDDTLVFFCHLGVQFAILSHLLGIPAPLLWQGAFVAPSSVTMLETEERVKGEAYFRCKCIGDTAHLYVAGEPVSNAGFFCEEFEKERASSYKI